MKNPFLFLVLFLFSIGLQAQTTISSSTSITQTEIDSYGWPVIINGGTISDPVVITLAADITLVDINQYFVIESEYVEFNGDGRTVTINNVSNYPGLLQNGTNSSNGYDYVSINNTRVLSTGSTLGSDGGWISQDYFGISTSNVIISNCSSNGVISDFCGGISGANSSCIIINSHSSGQMLFASGGIFGPGSTGEAINCFSEGSGADYCGGIFGYTSTGSASDCYSTGIIGAFGGGIWGYLSSGSATRCYSTGSIIYAGGGIAGLEFSGTIENSYSTGDIGPGAGGMAGQSNTGTITNCYSIGIIDPDGGGMTGWGNAGVVTNGIFEGTGVWDDNNAINALTGEDGSTWTDIDMVSTGVAYKLSSFNSALYSPDTESIPNTAVINSPAGNFITGAYSIVSINNDFPSLVSSIAINSSTGELTFTGSGVGTFACRIAYDDNTDESYQISDYTLNILVALPITWRSFTVTPRNSTAWLQWSTASEQNSRDFNVQHSVNGSSWTTIGTVTAAGNSTSISNYSYLHSDPVTGSNFYRIQQVDLDGKYGYSTVQKMQLATSRKSFSVVNTIVSNNVLQVNVQTPGTLYLYGNDGKLIWQKEFNAGLQNVDLGAVSKGIYLLKGKDAVEKILVR